MNFIKLMNIAAWALSGALIAWLVYDFIKVEKELDKKTDKTNNLP